VRKDDQLGLESTFTEYVNKLCDIFDEVKRVLKPTGSAWINIGDTFMGNSSYSEKGRQGFNKDKKCNMKSLVKATDKDKYGTDETRLKCFGSSELPNKCLCQIPSRFAIEMCNRGWILRNEIIWQKANCMPQSVKDRFTVNFEKVYFFTKQPRYYFEQQFEEAKDWGTRNRDCGKYTSDKNNSGQENHSGLKDGNFYKRGRNKRSVWSINTKPFSESHFAVFPMELIKTPILAGCPEYICNKCGEPKEKIIEMVDSEIQKPRKFGKTGNTDRNDTGDIYKEKEPKFMGYTDCGCNVGFHRGIVLDPFMGSGTTGKMAQLLNRDWVGIELNEEYIKLANKYLNQKTLGI